MAGAWASFVFSKHGPPYWYPPSADSKGAGLEVNGVEYSFSCAEGILDSGTHG